MIKHRKECGVKHPEDLLEEVRKVGKLNAIFVHFHSIL